MNTSEIMDKQIIDLTESASASSSSPPQNTNKDVSHLMNHLTSVSTCVDASGVNNNPRPCSSIDSKTTNNDGSLDSIEPAKVIQEKEPNNAFDASIVAVIDQTMKKHTDNLTHVLEGISARLTQLETSLDDLKLFVGNTPGSTDHKKRKVEDIWKAHLERIRANRAEMAHRYPHNKFLMSDDEDSTG